MTDWSSKDTATLHRAVRDVSSSFTKQKSASLHGSAGPKFDGDLCGRPDRLGLEIEYIDVVCARLHIEAGRRDDCVESCSESVLFFHRFEP